MLIAKMLECVVPSIGRVIAGIEILFGNDAKRADGSQRSALVTIEFVDPVTVQHEPPFVSPRQFEPFEEHIPWIMLTISRRASTIMVAAVVDIRIAGMAIARVEPVEHASSSGFVSKSRHQPDSRTTGPLTCSFKASDRQIDHWPSRRRPPNRWLR